MAADNLLDGGKALRARPTNQAGQRSETEEREKEAYFVASQWQLMWWKFTKHRLATIAWPVLLFLYVCAILADFLSPTLPDTRYADYKDTPPSAIHFYDPEAQQWRGPFIYGVKRVTDPKTFLRTFAPDPSQKHPIEFFVRGEPYRFLGVFPADLHLVGARGAPLFLLGTDSLGRDLFTRILYGSRISLSIGLVGVVLTFTFGLLFGGISGYFGGAVDTMVQRLIDLIRCIPTIPLWMALAAALPRDWPPDRMYLGIVLITSVIGWTGLARVIRGKVLALREEDFAMAVRLAGATDMRIIVQHLLPSCTSYIIVALTLSIPGTILGETSLSFLGLGLQPPAVSWGVLLKDGQNLQTLAHHPWLLWPAAWIIVTVLMFNFLGDGLRDAADPYK